MRQVGDEKPERGSINVIIGALHHTNTSEELSGGYELFMIDLKHRNLATLIQVGKQPESLSAAIFLL